MRSFDEVTCQALTHIQNKSLELGPNVSSVPVQSYTDTSVFKRELDLVFGKLPHPLIPSEKIVKPGDYSVESVMGKSILVVRQVDGSAKAFLNICRHRGAKLMESRGHDCQKLVCPYHGWEYSTSGALMGNLKDLGFSSKSQSMRLQEFLIYEIAGMIWICLDSKQNESIFQDAFFQLNHDSLHSELDIGKTRAEYSIVGEFNWKIGVEAFLEVYHFAFAHAPYLSQLAFPNLSMTDCYKQQARIVVPLKKPELGQGILAWSQVMYFIFPSTFLLFYDDHAGLITMSPISLGTTLLRYIPLVPNDDESIQDTIQSKIDFLKIIIGQDVKILEGIQKGLSSIEDSRFIFTKLESNLGRFHQTLNEIAEKPE